MEKRFVTEEEKQQHENLLKVAQTLDQTYYQLGQTVTSLFMQLNDAQGLNQYIQKEHKEYVDALREKYGEVNINNETGEITPIESENE